MRNEIKQYLKDHIYLVPMQIGSETVGREKAWVKARVCGNVAVTFIRNRNIFDIICDCFHFCIHRTSIYIMYFMSFIHYYN